MYMTEYEICQSYLHAKRKPAQIVILSQRNLCTADDIKELLELNGIDVTKHRRQSKYPIETILSMHKAGMTYQQIGSNYGVSGACIFEVIRRYRNG